LLLLLLLLLLDVDLPLLCTLDGLLNLSMIVAIEHLAEVQAVSVDVVCLQVHQHVAEEEDLIDRIQLGVV